MDAELDERICTLLSTLRLSAHRNKTPQEDDDDLLRRVHRRLELLISEEPDDHRRRRLRHVLPAANSVREQIFYLRKYLHSSSAVSTSTYATRVHTALTSIMKESFEEDYRKIATVVGVLDAVAELLVLDVDAFGMECPAENRTIRKLIASTLTNLTFGNAQSKQRLCSYPNLIEYVIRIIDESQNLAQVYAGLIRNLSWMADSEMSARLSCTVPALGRASLRAYRAAESKCLCATLSALWNLAAHSVHNKEAICEIPHFLEMLIDLLVNDAQRTALVEPASGVLKYASMYIAVVGASRYLSPTVLHKMVLRLIDLLNSPSFTIIGNSLGVLAQLLAKDEQLRVNVRWNHKAMQLLNHLRNSTRDDIRNPVKTVLDYLNAVDLSGAFMQQYDGGQHYAASAGYRVDGMSSSYGGSTAAAAPFVDSSRLLKLRSSHSHAPGALCGGLDNSDTKGMFTFNQQPCCSSVQQGFAPRPGDRQQQFASLPRQLFQQNKASQVTSPRGEPSVFANSQAGADFMHQNFSQLPRSRMVMDTSGSQTGALLPNRTGRDVYENDFEEDTELSPIAVRSDDPSFEVEDSVRCTRCTSTQSLSSLLQGDKSAWDSCNNSAINSNRLSPASATDLPDSPTQCTSHDVTIPSARDLEMSLNASDSVDGIQKNSHKDDSDDKHEETTDELSQLVDSLRLTSEKEDEATSSKANTDHENEGDYGIFIGRADSELLNQSIEAAMPKRVEVNDDFLADMIEQVQPKPPPMSRRQPSSSRNFSSASTARVHSGSSSMRTDDDEFLLQSIASVLPQSSHSRRNPSRTGSPPKKARAAMGEAARSSTGPKRSPRAAHVAYTDSVGYSPLNNEASLIEPRRMGRPTKRSKATDMSSQSTSLDSSSALISAALQTSSLVESAQTCEVVRDVSSLYHQLSNEDSETLSDDNYSRLADEEETILTAVPVDVDEEFQAEQVLIDCSVMDEGKRKETFKVAGKTAVASRLVMPQAASKIRKSVGKVTSELKDKSRNSPPGRLGSPAIGDLDVSSKSSSRKISSGGIVSTNGASVNVSDNATQKCLGRVRPNAAKGQKNCQYKTKHPCCGSSNMPASNKTNNCTQAMGIEF